MDSKREGFLLTPGFLLIGAAMLGAFSTLSQVFVFREALILLEGNELVLSALLCWWLFGLMMGTWFPTWLPLRRGLVPLCGGSLLLAPLLLVYSVTLLRHAIPWLGIPPGAGAPPIYLLILPFLSIFPLGLFYGFTFPVMACARDESLASGPHPESQTTIVSSVFMYEALGSVVGGLSLVLFLLPHYSAYQTVLLMFCASFTWLALGFVGRPTWMGLFGTLLLA
ncbi:MAG: hypothetical protein RBU29_17485, partial [bacterium]|nr:hypothetical protein [bacterium]